MQWLLKLEMLLGLAAFLPCVAFFGFGALTIDGARLNSFGSGGLSAQNIDQETLLSWILWVFCGFISIGSLASEVKEPRTYRNALLILIPVVACMNCLPFVVALSVDDTKENYVAGYFVDVSREFRHSGGYGGWLEYALIVGAICSFVGMYVGTH